MKEGYGCWCYFDPESITAKAPKGIAVNTVDEYCRSLQHGYQCAEIDGVESGEEADVCEPHSVFYYSSIRSILLGKEDLHESCNTRNSNDECAQRACTVEGQFVLNIGKAYLSGDVFDTVPSHAAGFDTDICHAPVMEQASLGGIASSSSIFGGAIDRQMEVGGMEVFSEVSEVNHVQELSCCGQYPNRFPYHSDDPSKECCEASSLTGHSKVFDSGLYECCEDGSTQVTCG